MSADTPGENADDFAEERHARPSPGKDSEFVCPECGNRCTRGPSGVEYGHDRGTESGTDGNERCPRRPDSVDPQFNGNLPWRGSADE